MNLLGFFQDPRNIYLALLCLVEIVGDFSFEKFANLGGSKFFGLGSVSYVGVVYFLIKALRGSSILYINGMWDGFSAIIETLAAFFILKERFAYPRQYAGIAMIVIGMFLLYA